MLHISGEARFADVMEQVLFNAGLSGVSLAGGEFTYTNPLRWHGSSQTVVGKLLHDTEQRWTRHKCYCCPPQVARTFAGLHRWACSTTDDGLWLHLYGGAEIAVRLQGGMLRVRMRSDYPRSGVVEIEILEAPDVPVGINLRIPGWTQGAVLAVNGKPDAAPKPASYAALVRSWKPGDTVALTLDLAPRIVVGHPRIEETRNHLAVLHGPVVYCLEDHDLPPGVAIEDVALAPDARISTGPGNVGGLPVLRVDAVILPPVKADLYAPIPHMAPRRTQVELIPYFAWNNRGITQMSVWLPIAWGMSGAWE
jgi:DUF1680 family protein